MANREPQNLIILAPGTTDSVNSASFDVRRGEEVTVSLYPYANLGADTATLKRWAPDDTWVTCTDDNGNVILSATRTMEVVVGLGLYRLEVPTRTASWGIVLTK